jgi:hypothetical protein
MESTSSSPRPIPRLVRLLALVISVATVVLGALMVWSRYAPERTTRYGLITSLSGADAVQLGVSVILLGLLPLMLLARKPGTAAWVGSVVAILFLSNAFFGARLWG